jgi:hypothetical protein
VISRFPLDGAYSAEDRLRPGPPRKRDLDPRLDRGASLLVILLLSLGLWAVIWVAVGSLASVV